MSMTGRHLLITRHLVLQCLCNDGWYPLRLRRDRVFERHGTYKQWYARARFVIVPQGVPERRYADTRTRRYASSSCIAPEFLYQFAQTRNLDA